MTAIEIVRGDIVAQRVDAVVNAANSTLLGGGGVDGAIHRAAGPKLLAECGSLGGCGTGEAKITKGYDLPAKFVIHTVGPVWHGGDRGESRLLADCYRNSFALARHNGIRTIAFPSISTGAYRFPVESAAPIALRSAFDSITEYPAAFEKIVFVLFSDADLGVYRRVYSQVRAEYPD
jgi:O-acetyl-ADP-ribose deacetylase (regulator of RNase III)